MQTFSAAVQQTDRKHGLRQREKNGFKKKNGAEYRTRDVILLHDHFSKPEKAADQKNCEKALKEAFAPGIVARHDDGEPQSQYA